MRFYNCFLGTKIRNSNDCPRDVHRGDEYSDHFARTQMLALSAAAYWNDPQLCLTTRVNHSQCSRTYLHRRTEPLFRIFSVEPIQRSSYGQKAGKRLSMNELLSLAVVL
uniref:Uncharacterized protein n=1 Tax=Parascaris equorum TaxID=6256 RepID=A0A914S2K9_PAREQ